MGDAVDEVYRRQKKSLFDVICLLQNLKDAERWERCCFGSVDWQLWLCVGVCE